MLVNFRALGCSLAHAGSRLTILAALRQRFSGFCFKRARFLRGVFRKPHFGSFWHMRFLMNAMLFLAVAGVLGALFPLSRQLGEFHAQRGRNAERASHLSGVH